MSNQFITNQERLLSDVINNILPSAANLDFLVGYFYFANKVMVITGKRQYFADNTLKAEVEKQIRQMDQLVYKLYAITPEEIEIVEGVGKT